MLAVEGSTPDAKCAEPDHVDHAQVRREGAQDCRHAPPRPELAEGIAVAIDNEIYQDALLQPISSESEVVLITKIAGG
jgi:hypothetical protein